MADDSAADDIERYSFLVALANDRVIDLAELGFIERLALRDGKVDDDEKAVINALFARIDEASLAPEVQAELKAFRERYGF